MNISKAALPPLQPPISEADRKHPRFNEYLIYRAGCSRNLIEANSFNDYLYQDAINRRDWALQEHPEYKNFMKWMSENQAGAPGRTQLRWPETFKAWLKGDRW